MSKLLKSINLTSTEAFSKYERLTMYHKALKDFVVSEDLPMYKRNEIRAEIIKIRGRILRLEYKLSIKYVGDVMNLHLMDGQNGKR